MRMHGIQHGPTLVLLRLCAEIFLHIELAAIAMLACVSEVLYSRIKDQRMAFIQARLVKQFCLSNAFVARPAGVIRLFSRPARCRHDIGLANQPCRTLSLPITAYRR